VAPGGEAKIEVTVATAGRSGRIAKSVRVHSNDPEQRIASLTLEGEIEAPAGALPPAQPALRPPAKAPATSVKVVH
jgi:hypothetical protein